MSTGNLRLAFVLEAIDKATEVVKRVNKHIDKLTEPARKVRAAFTDLIRESRFDRVAASVGTVVDRFDTLRGKVGGIVTGLTAIAATGVGAAFGLKRIADNVDQITDTARMLGITTQKLQQMGYAAQQNGSSTDEMGEALRFLSKNMSVAIGGSQEMQQWFARAGVSMKDLRSGMSVAEVFGRIGDTFNQVGDAGQNSSKKIEVMMALMGRGGAGMRQTLQLGADGLRKYAIEADHLGITLSDETITAMEELNDAIGRTQLTVFSAIANALQPLTRALKPIIDGMAEWTAANRSLMATRFQQWLDKSLPDILDFGRALAGLVTGAYQVLRVVNEVVQSFGGWTTAVAVLVGVIGGSVLFSLYALTTALWGVAVAFLATPFGLWTVGIAAVAAGAAWIYSKWEPLKQWFVDLWATITNGLEKVMNAFPSWLGGGSLKVSGTAPSARSAIPAAGGPVAVGGSLRITIDQATGKPKVTDLKKAPWSPMDLDVGYTGGPMALGTY